MDDNGMEERRILILKYLLTLYYKIVGLTDIKSLIISLNNVLNVISKYLI